MPLTFESVFGQSLRKTVRVVAPGIGPWILTVTVTESLTKKPVEAASILTDHGESGATDAQGKATITTVGGTRTLTISKAGYWAKTITVEVTQDMNVDASIVPMWQIAVGGIGGVAAVVLITAALTLRRPK